MLLTIQASTVDVVPPGTYQTTFVEIKKIETQKGEAYRWAFKTNDGKTISGLSDAGTPPSTKNKTGRWLAALSGQMLNPGVQIDPEQYYGKKYLCIVSPNGQGTKLETFSLLA